MAVAVAAVWALAWIVWILVALPHLSPAPSGGFQVGVTSGLPPRAIVVVLFFPILASVGSVAVLGRLSGKLDGWRYLAKGIKQAAIVSGRHWRLAPISVLRRGRRGGDDRCHSGSDSLGLGSDWGGVAGDHPGDREHAEGVIWLCKTELVHRCEIKIGLVDRQLTTLA